jgi:hypothetical protein
MEANANDAQDLKWSVISKHFVKAATMGNRHQPPQALASERP